MNTNRCKAWIKRNHDVLRCEGLEGHMSVHYCGDVWWPNKKPFPADLLVIFLVLVAIAAICWFIFL